MIIEFRWLSTEDFQVIICLLVVSEFDQLIMIVF